jgi:hypothetical protein
MQVTSWGRLVGGERGDRAGEVCSEAPVAAFWGGKKGWGRWKGRPPLKEKKARRQGVGVSFGGSGRATNDSKTKTIKRNGS